MRKTVKDNNGAFSKWLKERTEDSRRNYVTLRNATKRTKRKVVEEKWARIGRDLEKRLSWNKKVPVLNGKINKEKSYSLKDDQGKLLTEPEDVERRWNEYFEGLLNTPNVGSDVDISANEEEEENQIADECITT